MMTSSVCNLQDSTGAIGRISLRTFFKDIRLPKNLKPPSLPDALDMSSGG